jgi:hypothetical protein
MFSDDVAREKAKLVKVMNKGKLAKSITTEILMPILDQLEDEVVIIMREAAQLIVSAIKENMIANTPSGKTYRIVEYDGDKAKTIGYHTASAPGEPPALLSGTLVESIGYELYSDGSFMVGLLPEYGESSEFGSEFESSGFSLKHMSIILNGNSPMKATPVGTYGRALEEGFTHHLTGEHVQRPWFGPVMDELREPIRKMIRNSVQRSLNKITRRYTIRRAIVFKVYYR